MQQNDDAESASVKKESPNLTVSAGSTTIDVPVLESQFF